MSLLPERVDTSNVIALRDLADATVEWAREADDASSLWEAARRASALERYVDDVETQRRLHRARGWTLAHLGRVLGDGPGQGARTDTSARSPKFEDVPDRDQRRARLLRLWALDEPVDDEVVVALDKGLPLNPILRLIAERTPVEVGAGDVLEGDRWRIITDDFRNVVETLPKKTVDLIITDPPYPSDYLPLFSDLGLAAAQLLAPRGVLLVVVGQVYLPEILDRLGEFLNYGWTFCLDQLHGTQSRIMGRHIIQTWKPVLAYSTGTWPAGEWRPDRVVSLGPDQARFAWGQSVDPALDLITSYSRPDALILDPFTGGGAYGEAALRAGRRFLGVELVASKATAAAERLTEVAA